MYYISVLSSIYPTCSSMVLFGERSITIIPMLRFRSDVAAEDMGEDGGSPRPSPNRRRRRGKPQVCRESEHSTDGEPRESSPRQRRQRTNKTPAVYIGSIPRKARVSEVKSVIRDRDVNPLRVIWHSGAARTFLLFTSQEEAEKAVKSLDGLTILDRPVRVELAKGSQRNGPGDGESPENHKVDMQQDNYKTDTPKVDKPESPKTDAALKSPSQKSDPPKLDSSHTEELAKDIAQLTINGDQ